MKKSSNPNHINYHEKYIPKWKRDWIARKASGDERKGSKVQSGRAIRVSRDSQAKGKGKAKGNDSRKSCSECRLKKDIVKGTKPRLCIDCYKYIVLDSPKRAREEKKKKDIYEIEIHPNGIFVGMYFIPWKRYKLIREKVREWKENN